MRPDFNVVLFARPDCLLHDQRITGVKATGNVRMVNQGYELLA